MPYLDKLGIDVPAKYNISDFFMLELSDYKRKLAQKETQLNETEYKQLLLPAIEQQVSKLVVAQG